MLLLSLILLCTSCQKTIHEARAPIPHTPLASAR